MDVSGRKKGFTLIEILIVVSIIGLLASVIFVGLGASRARGRDARRLADLQSIQTGLELYFTKTGAYPATLNGMVGASGGIGVIKIPTDPTVGNTYDYGVNTVGNSYVLIADTEAAAGDAIYKSSLLASDVPGPWTNSVVVTECGSTRYCVSF